jgi:hypothetical protein
MSGVWKADTSKVCSPHLCRLRTDGLATVSKYWTYRSHTVDMSLVSLVVDHQQKVGFAPTAWVVGSGEKLDTDPRIGQTACYGMCREPFFLGSSGPTQLCWWLCKMLLCVDHVRYVWSETIHGLSVGCMWRVGRVFLSRCISIRNTATLGYE